MGIKRHRPEEIVTKLRQVEVLVGRGKARLDAIREVCISFTVIDEQGHGEERHETPDEHDLHGSVVAAQQPDDDVLRSEHGHPGGDKQDAPQG